jgi:hypothetical protein
MARKTIFLDFRRVASTVYRVTTESSTYIVGPWRHVLYAENAAALLRSILRRERLFEDAAGDRELKARLTKSLDDRATCSSKSAAATAVRSS